jgi:hypothetical protein
MLAFSVPAIVLVTVGMLLAPSGTRKRSLGIVLLSGAGCTALVMLTFVCIMLSPEFMTQFPDNKLDHFNDYLTGCATLICLAAVGALLIKTSKPTPTDPHAAPNKD